MATKKGNSDGLGHREDVLAMLIELFADDDGILQGQMMGHPCWFVRVPGMKKGKMFVSAWEQGIVVKLPDDVIDELYGENRARPFEPMGAGKSMRGWVYVMRATIPELLAEEELIHLSRDYVTGG